MQKRLATVERRSKELAGVFVKYEKANIERMEVRKDLAQFSGIVSCRFSQQGWTAAVAQI